MFASVPGANAVGIPRARAAQRGVSGLDRNLHAQAMHTQREGESHGNTRARSW